MSWYPDLGTRAFVLRGPRLRAIGWLSADHPIPTGDVPPAFLARLTDFCQRWADAIDVLRWPLAAGFHTCDLCNQYNATGYIAVPANNLLYVAPDMLAHYVTAHRYAPPAEFIAALLASPLPGTAEYASIVSPLR